MQQYTLTPELEEHKIESTKAIKVNNNSVRTRTLKPGDVLSIEGRNLHL